MTPWKDASARKTGDEPRRFNEATAMTPWKDSGRAASVTGYSRRFNEATAMTPWKARRVRLGANRPGFNEATAVKPWKTPRAS